MFNQPTSLNFLKNMTQIQKIKFASKIASMVEEKEKQIEIYTAIINYDFQEETKEIKEVKQF